jgi:hypothetical protein
MIFDLVKYARSKGLKLHKGSKAYMAPDLCDGSMEDSKIYIYDTGTAYCHRHSRWFSAVDFIRLAEGCDFPSAYEIYLSRTQRTAIGQLKDRLAPVEAETDKPSAAPVIPLPKEFIPYGAEAKVPKYFSDRMITPAQARLYGMGYCKEGYYANRMVIPVKVNDQVVGWQARAMWKTEKWEKKYLFPPGFASAYTLFNYDYAKLHSTVYLVEGIFDALAVGYNAMATFGTHLTLEQLKLLRQMDCLSTIIMLWDRDAYGKACVVGDYLAQFGYTVSVVKLPDRRDADELTSQEKADVLKRAEVINGFGGMKRRLAAV